jgi:hypothetical protein
MVGSRESDAYNWRISYAVNSVTISASTGKPVNDTAEMPRNCTRTAVLHGRWPDPVHD